MAFPPSLPATAAALKVPANREGNIQILLDALKAEGVQGIAAITGALATVYVECDFQPIEERGNVAYFLRYDGRVDLGNTEKGDGYRYRGRGFCQLTGRANYVKYGEILGIDLVNHPELALELKTSAKIFASFFKTHGMDVHCNRGNWKKVREIFNGGLNGWLPFSTAVYTLLDLFYGA